MEINSAECVSAMALSENPEFSFPNSACKNEANYCPYIVVGQVDMRSRSFIYPENIIFPTDKNSCSCFISSGLNIIDKDQHLTLLTWQMSGATVAESPPKGVNQINAFSFNKGITTIKYRGTDKDNNPVSYVFTVQVVDDQAPKAIYFPGDIIVSNIPGTCQARVFWNKPQFSDNCVTEKEILVSSNYSSGDNFEVGTTEVRYLVSDGKNQVAHSFNVFVVDNEMPKLVSPKNISTACGDPVPDAYTRWEEFKEAGGAASDNCDLDFSSFRYINQTSSGIHCPYTVVRTYGISDHNGNEARVQHIIDVVGEEKPQNVTEPVESERETILKSALDATTVTVTLNSITHVSCNGGSDGAIDLDTSSTNGPITSISWDDGPVTLDRSGLSEGTYTISLTDGDGSVSQTFTINEPAQLNGSVSAVDITCNGADDAKISVLSPSGGDGTYEYRLNTESWQSSGTFTGLPPGTYSVQIRDAAHTSCTRTLSSEVFTDPGVLDATVSSTNITCNGANDGTITITSPSGGYGNFEYRLNTGSWQSSGSFTGLSDGTYSVQIRDALNPTCTEILASLNLTEPDVLNASVSSTNITCNGAGDGTITISSPSGGYGTYQYQLNSNGWQNSGSFTSLLPGSYSVYIRDAANTGCVQTLTSLTITQPEVLSASASVIGPIDCYGETANVQITALGGTAPYTYSFETKASNATGIFTGISGSITGTDYEWSVTDANGCTTGTALLSVTQPEELTGTAVVSTSILCNGGTGTVTLLASGGTGTLTYTFNGIKNSTGIFNNVIAGNYNWSVTDENSCGPASGSINVTEPQSISINSAVVSSPVNCNGGTGEVTISANGGTGTLYYTFNGQTNTSGIFTGVYAGTNLSYSVTDDNGCGPVFGSLTVDDMPVLDADLSTVPMLCNGGTPSGEITVSNPSGGSGSYEVSINSTNWYNVSSASPYTFTGLATGNYYVEIRDAANPSCEKSLPVISINEPSVLNAAISVDDILCYGGTTDVQLSASGGTSPYTFTFNGNVDADGDGLISGISAGSYTWTVTDANGCEVSNSVSISEPADIVINSIGSGSAICEGEALSLNSSASGGTGILTYSWEYPDASIHSGQNLTIPNATTAYNGTYTLTVTDDNGCSKITSISAVVYATPTMTGTPQSQTVCDSALTTEIVFSGADSYTWINDNTSIGLAASGTGNIPSFVAIDTFDHVETATITVVPTTNGCEGDPITVTITVNPEIELTITNNVPVLCLYRYWQGWQWITETSADVNIILNSNVANTTYYWEYADGTPGSGSTIEETIEGTHTYTIYAEANGCYSETFTTTVTVIDENVDLELNITSSYDTEFCPGDEFSVDFYGGEDGTWVEGWGNRRTYYEWVTRFLYTVSNPNVVVSTSGGPIDDGNVWNPANLSFTVVNTTEEEQTAVVSIIPWAYWRSRECRRTGGGWGGSWNCDPWSDWDQLCAGEAYEIEITVQPFAIECPEDIEINTDLGDCSALLSPGTPVTTCPANAALTWDAINNGVTDSGSGVLSTYSFSTGTTTVTYTAIDNGETRTCSFDVTVSDNELPTVNCPNDTTIYAESDKCGAVFSYNVDSEDNCSLADFYQTDGLASGSEFPLGSTFLAFYAEDAFGNSNTCSFNVTVVDTISPQITCLGDTTVCAEAGEDYTNIGAGWNAATSDNCAGVTVAYTVDGLPVGSTLNGAAFSVAGSPHTVVATATDAAGNTASCSFLVAVNETPEITLNPTDESVCLNGSVVFTAAASGTPAPTFQWRKDGVAISDDASYSGTTTETLTISDLASTHTGTYDVVATNSCGSAISALAVLTVSSAPVVTTQPASQTDCEGNLVEFDVHAQQGNTPYSYDWEMWETTSSTWLEAATVGNIQFNADSSQLRVFNIGNSDNPDQSQYRVIVSDACGNSDTSAIAVLTVNEVLGAEISLDTICQGEGTSITAITEGATPLSYQWMFDDGNGWVDLSDDAIYSGTSAATLTINNALPAQSGRFRFMATFPASNLSSGVTECNITLSDVLAVELFVDDGPDIVASTTTSTICSGGNVEMKIYDANGAPGVTYSWSRSNESLLPGTITETWVADTLFLSGTLNSSSPGTLLSTEFSITGATVYGCESNGEITINVGDEEVPVVEQCPGDTTVYSQSGICGAAVNYSAPVFSDNCDGTALSGTLTQGLASGATFPVGITVVTYQYTDAAGNGPVNCSFEITVEDTISPTAICKDITVQLDASGVAVISASDIDNNSSDNCVTPVLSIDLDSFDCTDLGDNVVTLTASDSSGNTASCQATVTVSDDDYPVDISIDSIVQTPIGCYGGAATVIIHADGGVGTLNYIFNGVSNSTGQFTGIAAGTYSFSVEDAFHCGDTSGTFGVVQPDELAADIALTEVTCSSGDDGTITVIGSEGGSEDYEYQLYQNSAVIRSWQSDSVFANLSPGFYDIHMRDANAISCEKEIQSNVEVYILTADIAVSDLSCYGTGDGSITLTSPAGGTAPYLYSIDGTSWQSSGEFSGLSADTFQVYIQDNDACIVVLDDEVILTQPDSLFANVSSENITCYGANNGTIEIRNISGGSGNYEFNIGSGWQSDSTFAALAPGSYTIEMRDAANLSCERNLASFNLTEPAALSADIDSLTVSCFGNNDGEISIENISGGWGVYEFSIDGGTTWQRDSSFTALYAGTYDIRMRDTVDLSCETVLNAAFDLLQPPALSIDQQPANVAVCIGSSVGFSVSTSGGAGTVVYAWQKEVSGSWTDLVNGSSVSGADSDSLVISNVAAGDAGSYRVVLEDDCVNDTSDVVTLIVNEITALSGDALTELCEGEDFSIQVSTAGAAPLSYQWQVDSTGLGWEDLSGETTDNLELSGVVPAQSGLYRVMVSFDSCQLASDTRQLVVFPTPTVDSIVFPEYCAGELTSEIVLSGSPSNVRFDISGGTNVGLFLTAADSTAIPQFTTTSGTDTLTIIPRANGCYGEPYKLVIVVNPTPSIGVSLNKQTICSGSATNIDFSSLVDSVSYTWSIVSAGADISGYSAAVDTTVAGLYQVLYNSGSSDETIIYRAYAKNENCPGPTTDITITVEPDFDLVISNPDPDTVCQPDVIDLSDPAIVAGSTAGLNYEWYNGHPDLAGSTVIVHPSNISSSGTYYIKATDLSTYNYCYKIDSVTVLVAPGQVLALQGADVVYKCPLDDYDLQNSLDLAGSNVTAISYYGPDSLELASTLVNTLGDYFIVGTSDVGCTDTIFISLENYSDVETPVFDSDAQAHVCIGSSSLFYTATAVNSTGMTYSIEEPSNGNTIDANTGEVTFDPTFTGEIKVIATATGCTQASQGEFIITVHEAPVITDFSVSPTLICEGEPVYLSAMVQGVSTIDTFSGLSTTNYTIRNYQTVNSSISLTESLGETIRSSDKIYVTIDIVHDYDADLDIYLVAPSGETLELSTDNGGSSNNYTGTVFSTESSVYITSGSAPFNSTYHPEGSINDLVGADINGNWQLRIRDDNNSFGADEGTLQDWSLTIEHESSSSGSFTALFYEDGNLLDSIQNGTSIADTIFPLAGTHDYSVTIIDEYGCASTSGTIEVEVQESPDVEIEADYCVIEGKVQLTAVGGEPGAYYEWTTGESGTDLTVIVVDQVALHGVTVTNPGGTCSRTVYMEVSNELVTNGDFSSGNSGFSSGYGYRDSWTYPNEASSSANSALWDENYYGIGTNARYYHTNFWGTQDHTTGDGNYMIVNGNTNAGTAIWEQQVYVEPNTNYYFAAWSMSLNADGNDAVLQFEVNGDLVGSQARLDPGVTNDGNNGWIRFYSDPTWNSGTTSGWITIRIRNVEPAAGGNDFGLDDISFGTLDPLPLTMNLLDTFFCEGGLLHAESNSRNGLNPTYTWTHLETGTVYYTDTVPYLEIPDVTETNEGNYKLVATDDYGCDVTPDTFFIEIFEAATVNAGEDLFYCSVDSTIILQGVFGGSADSATWIGEGIFSDAVVRYDEVSGEYSEVIYHFSDAEMSSGTATLFLNANPDNGVCDPVSDTITITIYDSPVIDSLVVRSPVCNGQTNGSAVVYVSGGEGPYSYLWNTGSTSKILTGIGADTLWVTITDNKGCEVSDTVIITQPDSLIISARSPIVIQPSCYGASDGMAIIEVYGGIPPYTFEWDAVAALNAVADTAYYLAAGNYTVLVTDSAGCAAQTFPVEVSQPDPPVLNCPDDYIDSILPGDCGLILDTLASPVTDGYCDYTLYYYLSGDTVDSGTGELTFFEFPVGQTFVKYVIEDIAGNRDSCEYMVWIKHVDIPEANVNCPELSPDPVYAGATCDASVTLDVLTFTDPCNEIDSVWHNSPFGSSWDDASGTYPVGTTEFKWFVLDKSGNMDSSCVVQVTVVDTIKPNISCPENVSDSAAWNNCSKVPAVVLDPTYGDLCSDVTLSWKMEGATTGSGNGSVSDSSFNVGATTVTYVVEDESGNADSCSFTVTILDVTPPAINISECVDVSDTAAANYCSKVPANLLDPSYEDACWPKDSLSLSWIMTGATSGSGMGSVSDSAFNVGLTTVTYTVTDPDGNSDNCSFTVTIVDVTPPNLEITGCEDVSDTAGVNNCYVIPGNMNDPVYNDACWQQDSLRLSYVITGVTNTAGTGSAAGESFNIGTSTVEYTVTDPDGNKASCSFNVTIIHLEIPEASYLCPADTVWETASEGMCSADVTLGALTYTDLCNEIDSVWNESPYRTGPDDASGTYPVGSTTFNWYITDISGNIDSCEVTVVVADLPPLLTCPPDVDTTADYAEMYNSAVALQDPVYGDNCPDPALSWILIPPVEYESEYNSGELSGSGIYVSPDTFWVGTTTIWYYLEDAGGNRDSCYFTVTVQAAPIIECPPDTTIYLDGTENNCEATFDPGVPDLIQGVPPIEWTYTVSFADGRPDMTGSYTSPAPGYATPLGDIDFPEGVSTISWRAENDSGYDTCSHWVEVIDTIPPAFTTQPYENCVDPIHWAIYNPSNPNPVYGVDPNMEKSPSPDYRLFEIGDTSLDLLSLEDNCCDSVDMTIHWRIEFSDTPDPLNPTGPYLTHPDIVGTGQPSTYLNPVTGFANDINLWGDGVFFTEVVHHIYYWVEDCNGNISEATDEEIRITPRPEIIKINY